MRSVERLILLVGLALVAGACDRRGGLSGRFGELVVVQVEGTTEVLTREAQIGVPGAPMGESSTGTFVVRNVGDGPITLTKLRLDSGSTAFTMELPPQSELSATEETTFTVTFTPEQAADVSRPSVEHRAAFVLETLGGRPGEETAIVNLVATAEARDCFVPARLDFGEAPIGQAVFMPVPLSNLTQAPVQATVSEVGGPNPAFFSAEPSGATIDVAAGQPLVGQVRFAPATEAEVRGTLTVRRRASCPEGTIELVGRGSMQSLAWTPTELNFGRIPLNETATRVVTFSNRSGASIPLTIRATGDGFDAPQAMATLPGRGTVAVPVSCRPTALGALVGTLHVDLGTSPVLPARITLRCSGGGPRLRATPNPLNLGTATVLTDGMGRPLQVGLQPQLQRRLKLENVGTPPTTPTDTTFNLVLGRDGKAPLVSLTPLGRTQQGEFDVAVVKTPVAGVPALVGRNVIDLDVKLTPASVGLKEAALTIYSNDGVQPVQEVRLQANALVAEPCTALQVMPSAIVFGDVPPNSVESQTISLTNPSTARACQVVGFEIAPGSDPGFVLSAGQASSFRIGPGATVTTQVRFDSTGLPTGITAVGYLRFSAPGTTTVPIPLSARVAQCLVFVPDELDFGNIKEGCGSAPRTVQIFNQCGTPIRLTSTTVSGAGFGIAQQAAIPGGGLVLAPSTGLTTVQVAFRPPSLGTHLGALVLGSTEGASTRSVSVPLRGVGDTTGITIETYEQPAQPQADILFTIDDSCSMYEEQQSLAQNFNAFISYATTANVDYQIAVTTTDDFSGQGGFIGGVGPTVLSRSTPNVQSLFGARVNVGTGGSGEERPLSTTLKALTLPLSTTRNAGLIREDANLAVIIVTDAPDQSPEPIAYYTSRLPLVKGVRRVHQVSVSVIGPFRPASATCLVEASDPGRYRAVITQTRGVEADICTSNWATELQRLGESTLGPRSTFFVRNPPDTTEPIDVKVNGQAVSNAWSYNGATNSIIFQSGQAPGAGTRLTIAYQSQCL